jgi:capsular exopolysaccharide synthesis family protein
VVDSLDLQVEVLRPRIARDSVLRVLRAPREAPPGTYTYERSADGAYRLVSHDARPGTPRTERATVGEPVQLGAVTVAFVPELSGTRFDRIVIEVHPFYRRVEDLREDLQIDKQEGRSQLVEVSYRTSHPRLAAEVVNLVVNNYVEYTSATSHQDLRRRVETLTEQVAAYQQELRGAEEDLRDFRSAFQIVDAEEQAVQQVRILAEVKIGREEAAIERHALLSLLDEIQADTGSSEVSPYRKLSAFPSFITNDGIQSMLQSLNDLENARSQLLVRRTPQNADVRQLDSRINDIERQLFRLATNYLNTLEDQIASADASLARFGAEIETLPDQELEYARLLREAELMSEVYLTLQARLKEAEVQYAVAPEEVRVIDSGLAPLEPVSPRPLVTMLLATVLGLMVGVAAAVGREAVDTAVRSQWEAEDAAGGIPVVGMIPHLRLSSGRLQRLRTGWRNRLLPSAATEVLSGAALLRRGDADPGAAEAFRALHASISAGGSPPSPTVVVLTSTRPGDGKSLSAANLAISLARQGDRVLLVDGCLRDGTLYQLLGGAPSPGLAEVLAGRKNVAEALQQVDLDHPDGSSLEFLSCGSWPTSPSELLSRERVARFLAEVRGLYDRVIIDAPAVHRVADGALLGALADAVLLVVRSGATDRRLLQQTVTRLQRMRVPVNGLILNDVDLAGAEYHALPSPFGPTQPSTEP